MVGLAYTYLDKDVAVALLEALKMRNALREWLEQEIGQGIEQGIEQGKMEGERAAPGGALTLWGRARCPGAAHQCGR